ncbi:MAG: hypothetical protein AB7Q01_11990 [Gammaproteobacteria bacterium]
MDPCCHRPYSRVIASAMMGATLLLGGAALAQSPQVLEEAARDERAPMVVIPPSDGGAGRTLVLHPSATAPAPLPIPPPVPPPVRVAQSGGLRITIPQAGQPIVHYVGVFSVPATPSGWLWTMSALAGPVGLPRRPNIRSPLLRGTPFIPALYSVWRPIYRTPPVFAPGVAGLYRLPASLHGYREPIRRPHNGLIRRRW